MPGTLKVTQNNEIEFIADVVGGVWEYDGAAHNAAVNVEINGSLPDGITVEAASSIQVTNVEDGVKTATVDTFVIRDAEGNDVTSFFTSLDLDDTDLIQVEPKGLTVSTDSATKVYDGSALTAEGSISGFVNGETATFAVVGSQIQAGSSTNNYAITWDGSAKESNYSITENLGILTVVPQSIDPTDPPEPDPDDPGKPVYSNASVNSPSNVPYDGAVHQWSPTVTDGQGNVLTPGEDYTVDYSTDDFTNVTGVITVTITGEGNYGGTVTREYQITPREIVLTIADQSKVAGTADPTFTSNYTGIVVGETAGWTGAFVRDAGEAVGTYAINAGTIALADNPEGNFLASNYTLTVIPGTLTITAAPVTPPGGGDNPGGGTPDGTTPGTTPGGTATPTAVTDDGTAIEDDATPLATTGETIDDEGTPLTSGATAHTDCWVHWLMIIGLIVSAIYFGGVAIRRRKFSSDLQSFEDDVLGKNNNPNTNA